MISVNDSNTFREDVDWGNHDFISINQQLRKDTSKRDDMESIGYILIFFLSGYLPWTGKPKLKLDLPVDVLCQDHPIEVSMYINYCRGLRFDEDPDYDFLRRLFKNLFDNQGFERDFIFDWLKEERKIN